MFDFAIVAACAGAFTATGTAHDSAECAAELAGIPLIFSGSVYY